MAEHIGMEFETRYILLPTGEFAGVAVEKSEYVYIAHQVAYPSLCRSFHWVPAWNNSGHSAINW